MCIIVYMVLCIDEHHAKLDTPRLPPLPPQLKGILFIYGSALRSLTSPNPNWTIKQIKSEWISGAIKKEDKHDRRCFARKLNRYCKINSHIVLKDEGAYDASIYLDTNLIAAAKPLIIISRLLNDGKDIVLAEHPTRTCTYQEIKTCSRLKLDPEISRFTKLNEFYKKQGFPTNYGLPSCNVLIRKNNSKIDAFNAMWWNMLNEYVVRDQCSVMYVLWKSTDVKSQFINYVQLMDKLHKVEHEVITRFY